MRNESIVLNIGDLVTRPKMLGLVEHAGVALGPNSVLENTPDKGEHVATLHDFSGGKPIRVRHTGVNPLAIIARTRKAMEKPRAYDPISRNCEHTAYEIVYGIAKSPQVVAAIIGIGLLLGLVWLASRRN